MDQLYTASTDSKWLTPPPSSLNVSPVRETASDINTFRASRCGVHAQNPFILCELIFIGSACSSPLSMSTDVFVEQYSWALDVCPRNRPTHVLPFDVHLLESRTPHLLRIKRRVCDVVPCHNLSRELRFIVSMCNSSFPSGGQLHPLPDTHEAHCSRHGLASQQGGRAH